MAKQLPRVKGWWESSDLEDTEGLAASATGQTGPSKQQPEASCRGREQGVTPGYGPEQSSQGAMTLFRAAVADTGPSRPKQAMVWSGLRPSLGKG